MEKTVKYKLFEDLYEKYDQRIYRLCYSILDDNKDAVNDLVQEVYFRIWKNLEKFRGDAQIYTWIYRITINTAISYKKALKKNRLTNVASSIPLMETAQTNDQNVKSLWRCISQLDLIDRTLISLFLDELSYEEIHLITGITESNIGVRLNRVKPKLKKCIEQNHE